MSLNWKEINLILDELDLEGAQIQSAVQSAYDVIIFRIHKKGETKKVLISLSSGACRIHETFNTVPKSEKPLRFAQFLSSKIVNGFISEVSQLGDNRIVRLVVKRPDAFYKLYIRLWSNAANFIVTDDDNIIMDAMRRLPKRGEITGKPYEPESTLETNTTGTDKKTSPENFHDNEKHEKRTYEKRTYEVRTYEVRTYEIRTLPGEGSFNEKIDAFYAAQGGTLSLESLREQARRNYEGSIGKINASIERLKEKEASFNDADRFKKYGDLILSNISVIKPDDKWLELEDIDVTLPDTEKKHNDSARFKIMRIELEPCTSPAAMAGKYYEQYRKAKNGLAEVQREIAEGEQELIKLTEKLNRLLCETNPLVLAKLLKPGTHAPAAALTRKEKSRPGLSFRRGDWLIIVGRNANENDELLRRHVKGNDLWLHVRDYHGSYVFIKQRSGKTVPLDILLDAGNLAIFYSKGRNNRAGDLFYTHVKYLRRVKDGPKGLVIPTQEKNLSVKLDDERLRMLEKCMQ